MASSNRNTATLPQGFSIYQPALGAQLQFLPAVGTVELDELIAAYVTGNASTQEKRASVSLDFLEYAHVTGQTFKFYPVYTMNPSVESPTTDSGYGSSFNVSPVASSWDFSKIPASRSPSSQQARRSPNATTRHQTTDFSNLPGMKIMTKDGRDVTNSASRGSKTKEQRDHAHLMRIIKACDSCRRKKIRCDPSHKKRTAPQSQPTAKSTKKAKAVAEAVQAASSIPPPIDVLATASSIVIYQSFASSELETLAPPLPALGSWEEFIEYPTADLLADYDFFYDPEGYFSPESTSSSRSVYSTKPVTPTSQEDISTSYSLPASENAATSSQLPFNQTESIHDYVDFNLFSPESCFSEDDNMVTIELSRHISNQFQPQQPDLIRDHSPGGSDPEDAVIGDTSDATSWTISLHQSGDDESALHNIYRDPGAIEGIGCSPSPSSSGSDRYNQPAGTISEVHSLSSDRFSAYSNGSGNANGEIAGDDIKTSCVQNAQLFAGVSRPNAPRVDDNTASDSVIAGDVSNTSQILTRDESNSGTWRGAHMYEANENATAHVIDVTGNYAQSSMAAEIPGVEATAIAPGTLTGDASITVSSEATNTAHGTDISLFPAFDPSMVGGRSTSSASPTLDSPNVPAQTLNGPQTSASDTIVQRSVAFCGEQSSINRDIETYAEITHADLPKASLSETIVTKGGRIYEEPVATDSYDRQILRNLASTPSVELNASDCSTHTSEVAGRTEMCFAPCTSTNDGDLVFVGLLFSAMWILATNYDNSHMKQDIALVAIVLLSLTSVAGGFLQMSNAVTWRSWHKTSSRNKESILKTFPGNQLDILKSRASLNMSATNLGTSLAGILIAV